MYLVPSQQVGVNLLKQLEEISVFGGHRMALGANVDHLLVFYPVGDKRASLCLVGFILKPIKAPPPAPGMPRSNGRKAGSPTPVPFTFGAG